MHLYLSVTFLVVLMVGVSHQCLRDWDCNLNECCFPDRRALVGNRCLERFSLAVDGPFKRDDKEARAQKLPPGPDANTCVRYRTCTLNRQDSGCSEREDCISSGAGLFGDGVCVPRRP